MKKYSFLFLAAFSVSIGYGQTVDTIRFNLDGRKFTLTPTKINSKNDLNNYVPAYPFYIYPDANHNFVKKMMPNLSAQSEQCDSVLSKYKVLMMQVQDIETTKDFLINKEKERADMYQRSFEDLAKINNELNTQLKTCVEVGRGAAKKDSFKGVVFGILGGMIGGIITGVIITK